MDFCTQPSVAIFLHTMQCNLSSLLSHFFFFFQMSYLQMRNIFAVCMSTFFKASYHAALSSFPLYNGVLSEQREAAG